MPLSFLICYIVTIVWYRSKRVFTSSLNVERSNSDLNAHNTSMNSLALSSSPDCKKSSKRKHDVFIDEYANYGKRKVLPMVCFSDETAEKWWPLTVNNIEEGGLQLLWTSFNRNNTFIFDRSYFPWTRDFKFLVENMWNFLI